MKKTFSFLTVIFFVIGFQDLSACSLVKITVDGKTMVGNNEDTWNLNPKIWFEVGENGNYGAAYLGHIDHYPQGGMNEAGLVYDGFSIYPKQLKDQSNKLLPSSGAHLLKKIMQSCGTVEEVQDLLSQYDLSQWNAALVVFADTSGKYLLVEADTMMIGNDPWYVQVNGRPSEGRTPEEIKAPRYQKARSLLQERQSVDYDFVATVMDTMTSRKGKNNDGTLYSNVFDLKEDLIYLYFFHEFSEVVTFDLKEELSKGNHEIDVASLFSANVDYEKLKNYKTPQNSRLLLKWFAFSLVFVFISSLYFFVEFIAIWVKKGKGIFLKNYHASKILLMLHSLILVILLLYLMKYNFIFHLGFGTSPTTYPFYEAAAFFPVLITLFTAYLGFVNYQIAKKKLWIGFSRWLFALHSICFGVFPFLFIYWGILLP